MCKLTLITGLCLFIGTVASTRLVCYYNSEAENRGGDGKFTISNIDPKKCTHLIYAFSDINNINELVPSNAADLQRYQSFKQLKTSNPQLKTLLAVGGMTFNNQKFRAMVAEQVNRRTFSQSAIQLLRENEFDGLNLDWRYPGGAGSQPQDKERFTLLCKELKEAFVEEETRTNNTRLIITATVSAEKAIIDASYEVTEIAKYLDFINVLTFDFHGPWENVTGHHSPLFQGTLDTGNKTFLNTDFAMQYWMAQGGPPEKLNLGLAAYGRAFDLSTASSDPGAPASGPGEEGCYTGEEGFWASYETCLYIEGVNTQLINDQQVPYAVTENQWVGFDNNKSLDAKVSYLKTNNFGGAFVWSLDLDDTTGQFCKMGNSPFVSQLHDLLVPDFPSPSTTTLPTTTMTISTLPPPTTTPPPPTTTSTTTTPPTTTMPTTTTSPPTTTMPTTTPPTTTMPTTTTTPPTTTMPTTTPPTTMMPTTTTTPPTTTTTTPPTTTMPTTPPTTTMPTTTTTPRTTTIPTTTTTPTTTTMPTTTTTPTTTTMPTTTTTPTTTTMSTTTTTPTTTTMSTTTTTPTTTTFNAANACRVSPNSYFVNPANSNQYYQCDGTRPILQTCPPNLTFDNTILTCL